MVKNLPVLFAAQQEGTASFKETAHAQIADN